MSVWISPATTVDAVLLANTVRPADRDEIIATSGRDPLTVLLEALKVSSECWTATLDGHVLCMWGVVDGPPTCLGPRVGGVWLITSTLVDRHKRLFWSVSKWMLGILVKHWDVLENAIDCRHVQAIRWAARLGFQLEDPAPFGVEGRLFQRFVVTKELLHV